MTEIILIAAMAENRVIGKNNTLPWSVKGNLAHFKKITMGYPCIMGRKTWESLPKKPLPGRLNIVISKTMNETLSLPEEIITDSTNILLTKDDPNRKIKICTSLQDAIDFCLNYEKVFICGGESIYKQAMPLAAKIDLTLIKGNYDGDTFFPQIDDSWTKTETEEFEEYSIITYMKKEKL